MSTATPSLGRGIAGTSGISPIALLIAFRAEMQSALHKPLMSSSFALLYGTLFGFIVKMLLKQAVVEGRRRYCAAAFVADVLTDRKMVYGHVEQVRLLTPVRQSAKTYGDEMGENATAGLGQHRNVIRVLQVRVASVSWGLPEHVCPHAGI